MKRRCVTVIVLLLLAAGARAEDSVADLMGKLNDPNPVVKANILDELARRGAKEALVPMIVMLRDEAAEVRAHAADGLRILGDPRAVPFIYRALEDIDDTVRCRAILALGELGDRYLVPSIRRYLKDPSVIVRAAAVRALGEIADPVSLPTVLAAQRNERVDLNGSVTAAALIAAAKIGGKKGLDRSLEIAAMKLPKVWFLRAAAARAIAVAMDRTRIPLLLTWLREDADSRMVEAAAAALGVLGAKKELIEAYDAMLTVAETDQTSGFRRKAIVIGMARLPGKDVRSALIKAANDDDPAVVLEAADALAARGVPDALPVLIRLLEVESAIWLGAHASLKRRTGQDYGRNPPRWWEWYERSRNRFVFDRKAEVFRTK